VKFIFHHGTANFRNHRQLLKNGIITIFVNLGLFWHFETVTNIRTWIITQILENVVRCKYFEAGVHIKNPIKSSYQDGLGRMTQTLDHVVVVRILI
jgi:hypothetical protein